MLKLLQLREFDWDEGNRNKNWKKHKINSRECEQVFFNKPLIISPDNKHSEVETKFYVLGKTSLERKVFIVFTTRGNKIRIISARDMNRKEKQIYDQKEKNI